MPKIAVYTIAKNEEKFVERWHQAANAADHLVILDTGSTDRTVEKARALGITVHEIRLQKWRFELARNAALAVVPPDVDWCVTLDMDEVICPGWREKLEGEIRAYSDATMFRLYYWWNAHHPHEPRRELMSERIHRRHAYFWKNPVHEVLCAHGCHVVYDAKAISVHHHPDDTKPRSQYLSLLELAVREDPENDRNAHYLGREYMFCGRLDEAIIELTRHLKLKTATWNCERAASMRFIAACLKAKAEIPASRGWYYAATQESPLERDSWMDLAQFEYEQQNWDACVAAIKSMFRITQRQIHYIVTDVPWGELPYDIGSVAAWYSGDRTLAAEWMRTLLQLAKNPQDERLQRNAEFILGKQVLPEMALNVKPDGRVPDLLPKVSFVIPTMGRPGGLERAIRSIELLDYPHDRIQTIVVHDGEDPPPIRPESPLFTSVRLPDRLGVPRCVREGFSRTDGDWIVFASNDVEFTPPSIRCALSQAIQDNSLFMAFNTGTVHAGDGNICEHFMIHRSLIAQIGGEIFDTDFNHVGVDNLLWAKVKKLGHAKRCEDAIVNHYHFSHPGGVMDDVNRLGWGEVERDRVLLAQKLENLGKQPLAM